MNSVGSRDWGPVIDWIRLHDRFVIAVHVDPDADCIGSMLGMNWLLTGLEKRSLMVSSDGVPESCQQLEGASRILSPSEVRWSERDTILVVLDCEPERTGKLAARLGEFKGIVNIDHHATNPGLYHPSLIDPEAAATCELVYDLIRRLGLVPDDRCASWLYMGLMTDTGGFRFSNTSARSLRTAAELVDLGADPSELAHIAYETRSIAYMRLLCSVLETLRISPDGAIAWMTLTTQMLERYRVGPEELEGLVNYAKMVRGVEVAALFRETPEGSIKVSLRSQRLVNVGEIAAELGGGGHKRAAGCTLAMDMNRAVDTVLDRISSRLKVASSPGFAASPVRL